MSDTHEPSYYEIALTNRQVLIAFVILLVCLIAAFLSGVWVGRGDLPAAPERVAVVDDPAGEPEGSSVDSLSFFGGAEGESEGDRDGDSPAVPDRRRTDTTLAQDVGAETAPRREPPASDPAPAEPTRPAPPPREEPAAAEPTPSPEPPSPGPPSPAPPAGGGGSDLIVQVFSSRDRDQALKIVSRLQDGGRDAYLSPVEVDGEPMYRVRLGPFSDRAQAESVSAQLRRDFRLDTWITPR